jgi:hypothetical protein
LYGCCAGPWNLLFYVARPDLTTFVTVTVGYTVVPSVSHDAGRVGAHRRVMERKAARVSRLDLTCPRDARGGLNEHAWRK